MTHLQSLKDQVARLLAATTPAQVGAVYQEMVGYDSHAEDPTASLEDLRSDALDYAREVCYAEGIPCGTVGLLQPGLTVRFATPEDADEAAARFVVVELRGPRVLVEALNSGMRIAPQSAYLATDLLVCTG